jgi:hypothetical protein
MNYILSNILQLFIIMKKCEIIIEYNLLKYADFGIVYHIPIK